MTDIYSRPNVTDTQGIYEISSYANTVSGGILFPVIIWLIWILSLIATLRYGPARAFTLASFISAVLSVILAVLDLMSATLMYLFIFFTAVGFVWLKLSTQNV